MAYLVFISITLIRMYGVYNKRWHYGKYSPIVLPVYFVINLSVTFYDRESVFLNSFFYQVTGQPGYCNGTPSYNSCSVIEEVPMIWRYLLHPLPWDTYKVRIPCACTSSSTLILLSRNTVMYALLLGGTNINRYAKIVKYIMQLLATTVTVNLWWRHKPRKIPKLRLYF